LLSCCGFNRPKWGFNRKLLKGNHSNPATVSRGYRGKTRLCGLKKKSKSAQADFVCLAAVLTAQNGVLTAQNAVLIAQNLSNILFPISN
jgi:hypothetical protein